MLTIFRLLILSLCVLGFSQNAADQLGYPSGTKLLMIHADDLGVAHSVDQASFAALEQRAATSASIMVPCPWLTEVAAWAKEHPDSDLGLHLTLTAEWKDYRWGPLASGVPGLVGPDGYLWPDTPFTVKNARPEEVEREIRAQIDRAVQAGLHPTHLDSHMGTLFAPAFFPVYIKVAREYGIPFFAVRIQKSPLIRDTDIIPDAIAAFPDNVKPEDWLDHYTRIIQTLKPGLTEMIVHLGHDDVELQAITAGHPAYGSAWRQRDYEVITSPQFRKLLTDNHVTLIGWKEIKQHQQK